MYLTKRGIFVRNGATAIANGGITLVILLIAPLGLAAVIMNTILVAASTFIVCGVMDTIAIWLLQGSNSNPPHMTAAQRRGDLSRSMPQQSELDPPHRRDL